MRARKFRKKEILYTVIDSDDFYINDVLAADRSHMNVPFRIADERLEKEFLLGASELGFLGLTGHRARGGIRASIYNAVSEDAVQALAGYMIDFQRRHG